MYSPQKQSEREKERESTINIYASRFAPSSIVVISVTKLASGVPLSFSDPLSESGVAVAGCKEKSAKAQKLQRTSCT